MNNINKSIDYYFCDEIKVEKEKNEKTQTQEKTKQKVTWSIPRIYPSYLSPYKPTSAHHSPILRLLTSPSSSLHSHSTFRIPPSTCIASCLYTSYLHFIYLALRLHTFHLTPIHPKIQLIELDKLSPQLHAGQNVGPILLFCLPRKHTPKP
jgi:hypothetical protein